MKEVIGILREECWRAAREAAEKLAITELMHQRVLGRGKEGGLRYLQWRSSPNMMAQVTGMSYIPKHMVSWLVSDEQVDALVELIIRTCSTGSIGDGKIFVMPAESASEIFQHPEAETGAKLAGIADTLQDGETA